MNLEFSQESDRMIFLNRSQILKDMQHTDLYLSISEYGIDSIEEQAAIELAA
jgi:hypothetical protein